ncbi:MAG: HAD hydrolase-like protein [Oscillospiraceae bacterium]|nr:HAD hydrolase-like protein [Oscillospiraceae bacterium]
MMGGITTVLFDLDGTLLPMDQDTFVKDYFGRIAAKLAPQGYDPKALIEMIWRGTGAMVKNDGSRTNEMAFWELAISVYGERIVKDKHFFDEFYETEFDKVKGVCGFHPAAAEIVHSLKEKGYCVALATNPIFPARATQWRIQWAGLKPEDFALYTTYENARYCKPNLNYYRDILKQLKVSPEECLMVGNDVGEDMVARELGMQVFLLTDCLINKTNADISLYPNGSFDALRQYLAAL